LINNRQGGRRRGRGGGGPQRSNMPGPGNRQDNRQRGNAAQLLEKYKGLARDAQMQGDRVQTEYYLQYADHYFRVLNENRARFEEQRPRQDDYADDGDEGEAARDTGANAEDEAREAAPRREREDRNGEHRARRPRQRRDEAGDEEGGETIALDVLPPAIAAAPEEGEAEPERPVRARRPRRPRGQDEDIAPAA